MRAFLHQARIHVTANETTIPGAMRIARSGIRLRGHAYRPRRGRCLRTHSTGVLHALRRGQQPGATDAHTGTSPICSTFHRGQLTPTPVQVLHTPGTAAPAPAQVHLQRCKNAKLHVCSNAKECGLRQHSSLSHLRVLSSVPRRVRTRARCNRRILSLEPNHSGTTQMLATNTQRHEHIGLEWPSSPADALAEALHHMPRPAAHASRPAAAPARPAALGQLQAPPRSARCRPNKNDLPALSILPAICPA